MSIWEKIIAVLMAPFCGVFNWLDEHVDNRIVLWTIYLLWCATFGLLVGLGALFTVAFFEMKINGELESEE